MDSMPYKKRATSMPADLSEPLSEKCHQKKCRQLPALEAQATLHRMDIQEDFGTMQPAATEAAEKEAANIDAPSAPPMAMDTEGSQTKPILTGFVRASLDPDQPGPTEMTEDKAGMLDLAAGYWQMYAKCLLAADDEEGPPPSNNAEENKIQVHDNGNGTYHLLGIENLPSHQLTAATVGLCGCITIQMLRRILSPFTRGKLTWPDEELDSVLQDLVPRSLERYTKEMEKLHSRTLQLNSITAGGTTGRLGLGALFGLKSKSTVAEMAIYCPACQVENLPNAEVCKACGSKPPWTVASLAKESIQIR